jgi:very-short-patch-repair endonuclease
LANVKLLSNNPKDPSLRFVQPTRRGFEDAEQKYEQNTLLSNNLVRGGFLFAGLYGANRLHKNLLETNPKYLPFLQKVVRGFEDYTPHEIGRTFGISSNRLAGYQAGLDAPLIFGKSHLLNISGGLTEVGKDFQRLFGDRYDVLANADAGLSFSRLSKSSSYLQFDAHPEIQMAFAESKSGLAGSFNRLGKPINPTLIGWSKNDSLVGRALDNLKALKASQMPGVHPGSFTEATKDLPYLPFHSRIVPNEADSLFSKAGTQARNIGSRLEVEGFNLAERGQKLLAETFRLGATRGSYNRILTIPGLSEVGHKGLVNELLLKRVLPIYLGYNALKYADYLTGHHASNTLVDIPLKANLIRAELTDRIPGARAVTDAYENAVPGTQYAPLALPLGGAFLGGIYHYAKVLGASGGYKATETETLAQIRQASSKLLPDLRLLKNVKNLEGLKTGLQSVWKKSGTPAKGLILGALAMLPFIPGMLGSRKTKGELQDIYSGEERVPIRSGKWWSLGGTPFSGTRITAWRPHWSVLFKAHSKEKSLWGSESNYWAHNPVLHPLNFLKDPYALENEHYSDRPYPITSPAFSNIPLVGPLFAATIGKLVKPVRRMHEDEWDEHEYDMYSTRLNPKGPIVESKLERDILHDLSQAGYNTKTQVKSGDYRMDFVVEGDNGKKLAIEADGASYHGFWNAKSDAQRQAKLEKEGWDIIHIKSGDYFDDSKSTLNDVFKQLSRRGINPSDTSGRDSASGLAGLAPPKPREEFGLWDTFKQETLIASEFIGLPGYIGRTLLGKAFPDKTLGQKTYLQGSRQIDSLARSYYELNIGEGLGPNFGSDETIGYTEPIRRFIQRDPAGIQVNDIPNTQPSWMPGEDYLINFKQGDPYTKLDQGYARLAGAGYEAIHPELEGVNPEDYPDLTKLDILSDVAPYSREFNIVKDRLGKTIGDNTELRIRYEKLLNQAEEAKKSILQVDKRRFTGDIETVKGTVKQVSPKGLELSEFPGRTFKYSSLGMSAADLSAVVLGQNNQMTRSEIAKEVDVRRSAGLSYLYNTLKPGTSVSLTVPRGAAENSEHPSAVIEAGGVNINKELIDRGYAQYNKQYGGAETQAIFGTLTNVLGSVSERLSFDVPNFAPTPYHTKLWQERTAYDQYVSQEVVGTRMRRWDRPFDDFIGPYARGLVNKTTGIKLLSNITTQRRDLDTLADQLKYVRALHNIAEGGGDEYTSDTRRTNIGTNLLASPIFVASTIPDRDKRYFQDFLGETDPDKRVKILEVAPPELAKTLQAQWASADSRIAQASGKDPGLVQEQGRLVTEENLKEYSKAKTQLGYGDYLRSKEVANFFSRTGFALPESGDSAIFSNNLDYEDVKLKIIQNEGYDAHDFNIFDDRAAMLWRKPYVDGAVRELTSGDNNQSGEQIRRSIEQLMIQANNRNPKVNVLAQSSHIDKNSVKINIDIDEQEKLLRDIRRNPEDYQN